MDHTENGKGTRYNTSWEP